MVHVREDMTGWIMSEHGIPDSRLTVIKRVEDYIQPSGRRVPQYLCKCNCGSGKEIISTSHRIKNGTTKSCGCLHKEAVTKTGKNNKKYNDYDYSREYGVGYCHNTGNEFYFDWEDFELIKDYCWYDVVHTKNNYHSLRAYNKETKTYITMHQLLGCDGYDHEDRNPLNNRRNNLRNATQQENRWNSSIRKNNTSGVIGVCFDNSTNKWTAAITNNYKTTELGRYQNKEDAIKARLNAEERYYGEFAPQRHLFEQYGIETNNVS